MNYHKMFLPLLLVLTGCNSQGYSTVGACIATPFKIKGVNYSITSACSTSAHCIGNAVEQIQLNKQDVVFAHKQKIYVNKKDWITNTKC